MTLGLILNEVICSSPVFMSRDGYRQCLFNHLLLRQILIEFHNFPRYDIGFLSIFKKNNFGSWSPKANILVAEVAERQIFAQKVLQNMHGT